MTRMAVWRDSTGMTIPIVTECTKAPAPVERDPFMDEPQRPPRRPAS